MKKLVRCHETFIIIAENKIKPVCICILYINKKDIKTKSS